MSFLKQKKSGEEAMPTKKIVDPNKTGDGQIRSALRLMFLRSRERSAAIRRDKSTCQVCSAKGSAAKGRKVKLEVHHTAEGDINWERIFEVIRQELLCTPEGMVTLCKPCHKKTHHPEK